MFASIDPSLIIIALVVLFALHLLTRYVINRLDRWWRPIAFKRWYAKIEQQQRDGTYRKPVLLPESLYVVRANDEAVSCTDPEGRLEMVMWNDLQRVEIQTNALGPALPDLFWVLIGTKSTCQMPLGSKGEEAITERVFALPGVDRDAFGRAMSSTSNAMYVIWEKAAISPPS
ncbi:MAG: hypothetical protein QM703_18655 [Gemmatales bacterium]